MPVDGTNAAAARAPRPRASGRRHPDEARRAARSLAPTIWSGSIVVFLLVWQFASRFYPPALLPSPLRTFHTLIESIDSGLLLDHAQATLGRVVAGFLLGAAVGVSLGLLAGSVRLARLALDPYVNFFRFVPAIALLTPFVVWFGIGELPKVLLIAFATLFITILNTIAGVDDVPRNRLRAARMLGATPSQIFALVVVPSTIPYILTGMRIAMGVSFASIVVAEMTSADRGLGYLLGYAQVISATDLQFVAIVCLGAMGWAVDKTFQLLARLAFRQFP
ncbi:MAG TPA: ABC transporter permease [Magnetospirillaceae bacterium]